MIPAGEVNFSELAREIEIIGTIKNTINIILSGMLALNLIRYVYNLILTTLGIDNPYILEDEKEDTGPQTTYVRRESKRINDGSVWTKTTKYNEKQYRGLKK